jgi:hypothetical protein
MRRSSSSIQVSKSMVSRSDSFARRRGCRRCGARRLGSQGDGLGEDVLVALEEAAFGDDLDGVPSREPSSSMRWTWSRRDRPGSNSTRKSMSLVGVASPRATDPKIHTALAPLRRATSSTSARRSRSVSSVITNPLSRRRAVSPRELAADMASAKGESRGESRRVVPKSNSSSEGNGL